MKEKQRTDYDIIFEQQKNFLRKSCAEFDNGDESEAIRIAGHLRTMLHDSAPQKTVDQKFLDLITEIRELLSTEHFKNKNHVKNILTGIERKVLRKQNKPTHTKSLLMLL